MLAVGVLWTAALAPTAIHVSAPWGAHGIQPIAAMRWAPTGSRTCCSRIATSPTCRLPGLPEVQLPKLLAADVTIIWAFAFARALSAVLISPEFVRRNLPCLIMRTISALAHVHAAGGVAGSDTSERGAHVGNHHVRWRLLVPLGG